MYKTNEPPIPVRISSGPSLAGRPHPPGGGLRLTARGLPIAPPALSYTSPPDGVVLEKAKWAQAVIRDACANLQVIG
jgi:hypothetical protein